MRTEITEEQEERWTPLGQKQTGLNQESRQSSAETKEKILWGDLDRRSVEI